MKKHFVTFFSPGTFVAEQSVKEIDSWDVEKAREMAKGVTERHGATPYGFMFSTRSRTETELDSKTTDESGMYYLNCKKRTFEEIEAEADPGNKTLLHNMKSNKWNAIAQGASGWCQPLEEGDVILT